MNRVDPLGLGDCFILEMDNIGPGTGDDIAENPPILSVDCTPEAVVVGLVGAVGPFLCLLCVKRAAKDHPGFGAFLACLGITLTAFVAAAAACLAISVPFPAAVIPCLVVAGVGSVIAVTGCYLQNEADVDAVIKACSLPCLLP